MSAPAQARRFALENIEAALADDAGFCLECGAERPCCEPDAENYPCDVCGADAVFGALQVLMMDLVD